MRLITNKLMESYLDVPYSTIWRLLAEREERYKEIIYNWELCDLFEAEVWSWLVWTTFGHYNEHTNEVLWQFAGRNDLAPDEEWLNPNNLNVFLTR